MFRITCFFLMLIFSVNVHAQFKDVNKSKQTQKEIKPIKHIDRFLKNTNPDFEDGFNPSTIGELTDRNIIKPIKVLQYDKNKMPIFIKGRLSEPGTDITRQTHSYLSEVAEFYNIDNPELEWFIKDISVDKIGMSHIHVTQQFQGIPVYNAELKLHAKNGIIETVNGQGFPTPELNTTIASISKEHAERIVKEHLILNGHFKELKGKEKALLGKEQFDTALNIYHVDGYHKSEQLVYFIKVYENLASHLSFFIDAHSGDIIHHFDMICNFHGKMAPPDGPATANATDLNNITRTINTFEVGGDFYLIDGSRNMFSPSQSLLPNEPEGVIWTLDAFDTSPQSDDFTFDHIKNGNNSWSSKKAVSAHYNAGIAYEYFKNVHGRESINGKGGNIVSLINVTDEDDNQMDNAFWNGVAMWYGNGNQAFKPLAGAIDVAGHEMTHGVIQSSANLEYQGESGALNESFADIFAVLMDREDYQIGEDVVFTSVFPSGALRDLQDPHNGGSQLGDNGWQPAHTNEQFFGSADNGGVHINSGIPNHVFYLFAEAVGKDKAEEVFYRALTQYLTKSSQFVDLRNAVVQSTQDLYSGSEVASAESAFNQVGIGAGEGGNYQEDVMANDGDNFVVYADPGLTKLNIVNNNLDLVFDPVTDIDPISKPSLTDDGSIVVFVNSSKQIQALFIDWTNNTVQESIIQDQEIWSNVVVSKDGNRIAAVESEESNRIQIYDFNLQEWYQAPGDPDLGFELFNPTYTTGVSTGDAKYADAMEFELAGEILMYDAYSEITGSTGQTIGYWDIGFLNVFDNASGTWADGNIGKLFSQLEEGISVGNPTFSKNSPYIIAFDYLEGDEFAILGANIETGEVSQIFENTGLGYPSYTSDDNQMIFTNEGLAWIDIGVLTLNDNKISTVTNSEGIIIQDGRLGVAFNNGTRPLSSNTEEFESKHLVKVFPNPTSDFLFVEVSENFGSKVKAEIIDIEGRKIQRVQLTNNKNVIRIGDLPKGTYSLIINSKENSQSILFTKI